ncbi:hypothetical protein LCGC14_2573110, partial [marine sediment metagenome]
MAGLPFNRLPASGPMAQQAEQEYKAMRGAAGQEYEIEMKALGNQYLTDEQYNNKAAVLHGKHSVKALQMNRQWDQRMTQIQQYEKLGAAGTIAPGRASQEQFALSGYDVPTRKKPDLWAEHQKLIQERERMEQYLLDTWGKRWGKTRKILETNDKGKVTDWGRVATEADQTEIDGINQLIRQLDQYELALMTQMDPQQRKVNQLSRAMTMGPRTQQTPGVGGKRERVLLGTGTPKDPFRGYASDGRKRERERERLETPGYKMTREKAITQAQRQLGTPR